MQVVGQLIEAVLWSFLALLWVRFVAEWVQMFARSWSPRGVVLVGLELAYTVTDTPIKALRRVIPPLRLGGVALDVSFLVVLLAAFLVLEANRMAFAL
ncbi:MAG: YggT family protein [Nocardioides sp.]